MTINNRDNKAKPLKMNAFNFDEYIAKSNLPALIGFGANWQMDSLYMYDALEWFCHKFDEKMIVAYADIDYVSELFYRFDVTDFPTLIIFEDGKEFARHVGYDYIDEIDDLIKSFYGYLPYDPKARRL